MFSTAVLLKSEGAETNLGVTEKIMTGQDMVSNDLLYTINCSVSSSVPAILTAIQV